jgi:hypothetical protein
MVELALRFCVYQAEFFFGSDAWWNLFDFAIICQGTVDAILTIAGNGSSSATFLRVIRVFKVSKVLRMFEAVRAIKELRIMFDALLGSITIFIWCSILFAFFLSVVAIFFVDGVSAHKAGPGPIADEEALTKHFGSVGVCIVSLFRATSGGDDWSMYYEMIESLGWEYVCAFLTFQAYTLISFWNTITGVFTRKTLDLAKPSMHEIVYENQQKRLQDYRELIHLLKRVLHHSHLHDKLMTEAEFEKFLHDHDVRTYFLWKGMSPANVRRFFNELLNHTKHFADAETSQTDSGETAVQMSVFVSACIKLHSEQASRSDLHVMYVRQLHSLKQLKNMTRIMGNVLQQIYIGETRRQRSTDSMG